MQRRIDLLASEGINFRTNCEVGKDVSANEIMENFDAVLLSVGSVIPRDLNLPGEELFAY